MSSSIVKLEVETPDSNIVQRSRSSSPAIKLEKIDAQYPSSVPDTHPFKFSVAHAPSSELISAPTSQFPSSVTKIEPYQYSSPQTRYRDLTPAPTSQFTTLIEPEDQQSRRRPYIGMVDFDQNLSRKRSADNDFENTNNGSMNMPQGREPKAQKISQIVDEMSSVTPALSVAYGAQINQQSSTYHRHSHSIPSINVSAPTGYLLQARIPARWEDFSEDDKLIVNMRYSKSLWPQIDDEREKLTGRRPGKDGTRKRFAKLQKVLTETHDSNNTTAHQAPPSSSTISRPEPEKDNDNVVTVAEQSQHNGIVPLLQTQPEPGMQAPQTTVTHQPLGRSNYRHQFPSLVRLEIGPALETFIVEKVMLETASPFMKVLNRNSMATISVKITEISADTFTFVLEWLYKKQILGLTEVEGSNPHLSLDTKFKIFALAAKLGITALSNVVMTAIRDFYASSGSLPTFEHIRSAYLETSENSVLRNFLLSAFNYMHYRMAVARGDSQFPTLAEMRTLTDQDVWWHDALALHRATIIAGEIDKNPMEEPICAFHTHKDLEECPDRPA